MLSYWKHKKIFLGIFKREEMEMTLTIKYFLDIYSIFSKQKIKGGLPTKSRLLSGKR